MVNLDKMLDLCRTRQWHIDDLDWSVKPPSMPKQKEMFVVQFFTNMAGIERLAGALFEEQRKRADNPKLAEIFASFVGDEERHAQVAERLAKHYNVNRYKTYRLSKELTKFRPHFIKAVRQVTPEVANAYVTAGELMLDIALLRSVDDYLDDPMTSQAMELINRDEARHVAMDYHMTEYYSSAAYLQELARLPKPPLAQQARVAWHVGNMVLYARPFLKSVFLHPMDVTDPEGERIKEAIKRIQLLTRKPEVAQRPLAKVLGFLRDVHNTPIIGQVLGRAISVAVGAPSRFIHNLYSAEEAAAAMQMSLSEMAEEAVAVKYKDTK